MAGQFLENVPVDQIIALSCQGLSLVAAVIFYHWFHIKSSSVNIRHAVAASLGVTVVLLCYGIESLHLFTMVGISYCMMVYLPVFLRGWTVFVACIGHVLAVHLYAYLYHYMEYRVEVSNSLMVLAIKISCTAFSLDDNFKDDSQLSGQQLKHKIRAIPAFYEYFSFCFCFIGVLFGPAYHLSDYLSFIRGDHYKTRWPLAKASMMLLTSIIVLFLHYLLADTYGVAYNLAPEVMKLPLLQRHIVLWFTMLIARCRYYFGWLSSEAVGYFCGMGYDPEEMGEKEWDTAIFTVNPWRIEFATSLKMFSDNWNVFTARWLHFCVYERVKHYKVLIVFVLSATWHGFYPGYFLMFMPLALAILLGRKLRRTLRPVFLSTAAGQRMYDVITWLTTVLLISFNSCAFELRQFELIYSLQRSFYFWPHIAVLLGVIFASNKGPSRQQNGNANGSGDHISINSKNGIHKLHAE